MRHIWDVESHIWSTIWLALQSREAGSMSASVSGGDGGGTTKPRTDRGGIVCGGAVVSKAARRHDISPQHLFAWREAARAGLLSLPADDGPMFVIAGSSLATCSLWTRSSSYSRTL
jgi:Transposase